MCDTIVFYVRLVAQESKMPSYSVRIRVLAPRALATTQYRDRTNNRECAELKDVWIYSTQIYSGVLALILRVRGGQLPGLGLGLGAPGWAR